MARNIKKTYKSDAGFNFDTFQSKGGNIGNIDMSDFRSKSNIIGKTNIGKKMSPSSSRFKSKIKNQKEDGLLSKLYKALSTKSTSYDPTKAGLGGAKFAQRNEGGVIDKFTETDFKEAMKNFDAQMKAEIKGVGSKKVIDKAYSLAKQREEGGRFSVSDIEAAMRSLSKKKKPDFTQKNKGGLQEDLKKLKARGLKDGSKNVVKNKKKKKKFPDLNKDGKVTFKDILIGRGVVKANKGTMVQAKGCGMARKKKTKMF